MKKKSSFLSNFVTLIFTLFLLIAIFYVFVTQIVGEEFTKEGIGRTITITKETLGWEEEKVINLSSIATKQEKNFYENQIGEYPQIIYTQLENNKEQLKTGTVKIDFGTTFNTLLQQTGGQNELNQAYQIALDAFLLDYPEVFYLDVRKMYLIVSSKTWLGKTTHEVTIEPEKDGNYLAEPFETPERVQKAIQEVEQKKKKLLAQAPDNTYDKIVYFHDWLVENNEYDTTLAGENIHNIYGALIGGKAVCEGYAKCFQYLMQELGIAVITVVGDAKQESSTPMEAHAWNYLQLNGKWYGVDVTWDDPIVRGGKQTKVMQRKFFLRGKDTFSKRHFPTGKASDEGMAFSYPELSESDF